MVVTLAAGAGSTAAATDDYVLPGSFTISAGTTSSSATVTIVDDKRAEGDEDLVLTASVAGYEVIDLTLTITDDDPAGVTLSETEVSVVREVRRWSNTRGAVGTPQYRIRQRGWCTRLPPLASIRACRGKATGVGPQSRHCHVQPGKCAEDDHGQPSVIVVRAQPQITHRRLTRRAPMGRTNLSRRLSIASVGSLVAPKRRETLSVPSEVFAWSYGVRIGAEVQSGGSVLRVLPRYLFLQRNDPRCLEVAGVVKRYGYNYHGHRPAPSR